MKCRLLRAAEITNIESEFTLKIANEGLVLMSTSVS